MWARGRWGAMLIGFADRLAARLTAVDGVDFASPPGEASMVPPGSVSWRVFGNPITLLIGGIAAVLLELGEPRVRHGVWDHSSFKRDPAQRLRRTGMAAMVTVYGARSEFEALAARVRAMHARVTGTTPDGQPYAANDPDLLLWVQVTAAWGFLEAYHAYAGEVRAGDRDRFYAEGQAGAALYGVESPPASAAAVAAVFARVAPQLEPSPILHDLLAILRTAAILPGPMRWLQPIAVRAAVDLVPPPLRTRLGLDGYPRLRSAERLLLRSLARLADRVELPSSARAQAARRIEQPIVARDTPMRTSGRIATSFVA